MTTESVILTLIAVMMMAIFLGPNGVNSTFDKATPRLAARIERNIAIGYKFNCGSGSSVCDNGRLIKWEAPPGR